MELKNETPLVSVLIPAYNHEKYVQESIKSIISQTYKNIELLVINDGSSDSTWQKLIELESACKERFIRVVFWNQSNMGCAQTLNNLLSNAQGDYIYLIASDDVASSHAIETEVDFLESNKEYALVVGDSILIDSEGKRCYWNKKCKIVYEKEKAEFVTFCDFLQKKRGFSFLTNKFGSYKELYKINHVPNGYLIKKEIFENFRYTKEAPLEDWNLMLYIAKYHKMKYLDEILFMYRQHSNNTIRDTEKMMLMENMTRQYEDELLCQLNLKKTTLEATEFIKRNLGKKIVMKSTFSKIYKRVKLAAYSFIFSVAQFPLINFLFPKRIIHKLLVKILYLGEFKI